eukprot:GFUD01049334.1.p1 GENE.GFUD01049334.1~~GFUD01049334.1.p1  ORF type:complete len:117 (+),score=14.34 GFUD01049334.1:2-352(+)
MEQAKLLCPKTISLILLASVMVLIWLYSWDSNVPSHSNRPSYVDTWTQEQSKRKSRIEKVCQEHGDQLYYDNLTLSRMLQGAGAGDQNTIIFIPKYNILYCGIPKCGTTSWYEGRD